MQPRRSFLPIGLLSACVLLLAGWLAWSMIPTSPGRPQAAVDDADALAEGALPVDAATGQPLPTPQVDFSGQWQLDLKASDSLDEILKAIGTSVVERMILDNAPITQVVTQTDSVITIDITSGPYHRTDVLWLDGRQTKSEDPSGRPVISVSTWNDEGTAVVTKVWQESQLDFPPWVMTRTLTDDGRTTYVVNEYAPVDGAPLASRRVYRRIGPAADKTP